jgi:predicted RND superfamily exporter protein
MNKLIDFITNKPKYIFSIVALLTIAFGFGLTRLEMENTQDAELPADDPMVITKERIEEIFGKKDIILIGIKSDNIFTHSTLSKIRDIEEELKSINGVISDEVVSIVSVNNITGHKDGVDVGVFIPEIPEDKLLLDHLKEVAIKNEMIVDRIISKDGSFSAIIANIEDGYVEEYVYAKVHEIVERYEGPEKVYMSGDPIQQKEIDMGISGDVSFLLPLALLVLLSVYFFAYRTKTGVILPFSVVLLSIIWTMGFMGLTGYKMNLVSSVLPILMLVISGSYGIHYMQKFYEEYAKTNNISEARSLAIKLMFKPIMLTGITSAVGTFTLVIFKVRSIQEFGVIASVGILLTFIISIFFISSLLWMLRNKKLKKSAVIHNKTLNAFLKMLASVSLKYRKTILALSVIVLIVSIYGVTKIEIGNDFIEYFPKDHRLRVTYNEFNQNLSGARYIDIMFEGNEVDAVKKPQFLKEIDDFLKYTHTFDYVGNTFSVVDVIKRMNKELHDGNQNYETIPDNQNEIAQYLLLYGMSGNPGDFNSLIDYDYQRTKVRMMLTSSDQADHTNLYYVLDNYAKENFNDMKVEFGGEVMFWLAQVDYIVIGKIQNILCAIIIVLLMCALVFRSVKYGIISIIPLTIASLFTFGVMGFIGLRLETATAIITSIGIGIGVDFAIHYITSLRREMEKQKDFDKAVNNVMASTGKAIFLDVTTNILGFIIFLFSGFIPLQQFGWLISLTMLGTSFGSLLLFPAIFKLFKVKF